MLLTFFIVSEDSKKMEDRLLRRAGLDYHEAARVQRHASWAAFQQGAKPDPARLFAFTTRAQQGYADIRWQPGDWLMFGSESAGLPQALRDSCAQQVRLPMRPAQRSLDRGNPHHREGIGVSGDPSRSAGSARPAHRKSVGATSAVRPRR